MPTRARLASPGRAKVTGARHPREWSAEIQSLPCGGTASFCSFIFFGDLASKSVGYRNLIGFRSRSRREIHPIYLIHRLTSKKRSIRAKVLPPLAAVPLS